MKAGGLSTFLARIDAIEYDLCRCVSLGAARLNLGWAFRLASRLGDGVAWYVLIVVLPLAYGRPAVRPATAMALTGVAAVLLYKWLKGACVRERPFVTHASIDCAAPPLDRYSFPSGHTLHAVAFTLQAVAHFGVLAWILVPLTFLIAVSRVALGLHYVSDVIAGALLGALLGAIGLELGRVP